MKDYLAIIRKLDFVDLFKYGYYRIAYAVPFDGNVEAHTDDDELFNALTYKMNMYEYSFEYLIIHFKALDCKGHDISVEVRNLCGVYAFDIEAKKEMSISFDPRIQLHVSPWSSKFGKLHQKLSIKQSMRGVDNLWSIFDLDESDHAKCEQIIKPEFVQEVFRELYANERPVGKLSIWTYLLRYERHGFYPKDMIGFFCDFIHVYCNFLQGKELSGEVAETTKLFPHLISCKDPNLLNLYEIVEESPLSQMTEQAAGCRFAMAAPLFLFLKSKFIEGMEQKPNELIISHIKEVGGFECSIAVYLLGIALGHNKTYDAFYESADLQFFKKKKDVKDTAQTKDTKRMTSDELPTTTGINSGGTYVIEGKVEPVTSTSEDNSYEPDISGEKVEPVASMTENTMEEGSLGFDETRDNQTYDLENLFPEINSFYQGGKIPIMWMRTKPSRKKVEVYPVLEKEDFNRFSNLGYEPVRKYNKKIKELIALAGYDPEFETKRCRNKKLNIENHRYE